MTRSRQGMKKQMNLLERELLHFYDEFTEHNACIQFAMQAFVAALASAEETDQQSTTGAMFWIQRLNDRTLTLEQRLRNIRQQARDLH